MQVLPREVEAKEEGDEEEEAVEGQTPRIAHNPKARAKARARKARALRRAKAKEQARRATGNGKYGKGKGGWQVWQGKGMYAMNEWIDEWGDNSEEPEENVEEHGGGESGSKDEGCFYMRVFCSLHNSNGIPTK